MTRWILIFSAVAAMLAGCAHGWARPGVADERQKRLDVYACARDAGLVGVTLGLPESDALFRSCMEAHGYSKS